MIPKFYKSLLTFKTLQSKIIIFLGITSIIIVSNKNTDINQLLIQFFAYWVLARNTDCIVFGGCNSKAWFSLMLPLLGIVLSLMFRFSKFKKYKNAIKSVVYKVNSINSINNNSTFIRLDD